MVSASIRSRSSGLPPWRHDRREVVECATGLGVFASAERAATGRLMQRLVGLQRPPPASWPASDACPDRQYGIVELRGDHRRHAERRRGGCGPRRPSARSTRISGSRPPTTTGRATPRRPASRPWCASHGRCVCRTRVAKEPGYYRRVRCATLSHGRTAMATRVEAPVDVLVRSLRVLLGLDHVEVVGAHRGDVGQ